MPDLKRLRQWMPFGGLQVRLTVFILIISGVLLTITVAFIARSAQINMEKSADEQLEMANYSLTLNTQTWLDLNTRALRQLAALPSVVGMEAESQKPVLEVMQAAYPHMYLISTTDLEGKNVARSDTEDLTDYSDRDWYIGARDDAPLTFQSLIGRTSGEPAIVVSTPIRDSSDAVIGTAMFASDLNAVTNQVNATRIGKTGVAYVVDAENQLISHPDAILTAQLLDYSSSEPIIAARDGQSGFIQYTDDDGTEWRSFISTLDNGWIIIVSQTTAELLTPIHTFQVLAAVTFAVGLSLLVLLSWFTIRHTVQPILKLTETAVAIADGDLNRTAPVTGNDEISILANAFNSMTARLRQLIADLEQRAVDLTKAVREAKEASRLKDEFLSVMSHELRTPLNAIIGYTGIVAMREQMNDDDMHMVQRTRANAERLLSLINDVLDISRIEAGRLQIVPVEVDIRDMVVRTESQMSVLAEDKGLDFSVNIHERVPQIIMIDEDAFIKIITNLTANAIKFTETGKVALEIDSADNNLVIKVTDTGIGIPQHMQEIIFERFRQVDGSSKRAHGGSGLGLAIVKNLCQAIGGTVTVTSVPGEGSTFTVTLPLEKINHDLKEMEQVHVLVET